MEMSANFSTSSIKNNIESNSLSENKDFLSTQIITYLGNKRSLLANISREIQTIKKELK